MKKLAILALAALTFAPLPASAQYAQLYVQAGKMLPTVNRAVRNYNGRIPDSVIRGAKRAWKEVRPRKCRGTSGTAGSTPQFCN